MEPMVKEFIEKAQAKEREEFEKERDKVLISLGLISETGREYSASRSYPYTKYDADKKAYYCEKKIPVKVTDEEFEIIKKYAESNSEPDKSNSEPVNANPEPAEVELDNGAEKFLGVINGILLAVSIIASVILMFLAIDAYRGGEYYFIGGLALLLLSLISFASIKVILNISNNLHKINSKLK